MRKQEQHRKCALVLFLEQIHSSDTTYKIYSTLEYFNSVHVHVYTLFYSMAEAKTGRSFPMLIANKVASMHQ